MSDLRDVLEFMEYKNEPLNVKEIADTLHLTELQVRNALRKWIIGNIVRVKKEKKWLRK